MRLFAEILSYKLTIIQNFKKLTTNIDLDNNKKNNNYNLKVYISFNINLPTKNNNGDLNRKMISCSWETFLDSWKSFLFTCSAIELYFVVDVVIYIFGYLRPSEKSRVFRGNHVAISKKHSRWRLYSSGLIRKGKSKKKNKNNTH